MPYTPQDARKSGSLAKQGDLVYQLTLIMLQIWNDTPKFDTIANLRRLFVTEPKNNPLLNEWRNKLAGHYTVGELYTAAERAFTELDRQLFSRYEDLKRLENGSIPELDTAIKDIEVKIENLRASKTH